uniref:Uncharacterized protein n=1 Tax=Oryza glaberrima TaxID=4538 RepID=A0A1V1H7L5_ORYGL|nr:hypothetical protein [Oryza glaberrima]
MGVSLRLLLAERRYLPLSGGGSAPPRGYPTRLRPPARQAVSAAEEAQEPLPPPSPSSCDEWWWRHVGSEPSRVSETGLSEM